jgi:hypothetical protein
MAGGKPSNIGMIQIRSQPDGESHGAKFSWRNILQPERIAILFKVKPGGGIGKFQPRAIGALQSEIAEEVTYAGEGKTLTRLRVIAKRSGLDALARKLWRDGNLQRGGKGATLEAQEESEQARKVRSAERGVSTLQN